MKSSMQKLIRIGATAALLIPSLAAAHPGHAAGFVAGMTHPLLGIDHLLAILAIGVWSAQMAPPIRHAVPVAFVLMMVVGALVGMGQESVAVEWTVTGSVLALGLLIALAVRPPPKMAMLLASMFAVLHGHAHGSEVPAAVSGATFLIGMAAITLILQLSAAAAARSFLAPRQTLLRLSGAGFAVAGLLLLVA